ncbi:glycosyltransferase family 2 protein [Ruminococcaceae bacterium OttesenSCG-928-I18]|nr:glycosyltransferase family 2 protein [Ruminococcaceae bacterium OttesenSCG-928-I18]
MPSQEDAVRHRPPPCFARGAKLCYTLPMEQNTQQRGGAMEPKASIVLPNLNGAGWLEGCIQSLYAQTEQGFELIIVDNGSTDESLATARGWAAREENCRLVEMGENTGFSRAVNRGISLSRAPYVLLFNNDAFAEPGMLSTLLSRIEQAGDIFAVQPLMRRHFEPEKADDCGDFVTLFGWAFKRGDGLPAARYQKAGRVFSACGGAALYRKSLLGEIGGFEEHFFAYLEDVDISWRANSRGYRCLYEPAACCTHICGATTNRGKGGQYNAFKSIQSGRNSLLLPYKNMPLLMLVLNFPFLLVGYLVKTLVFHLRGFGPPWRQGFLEGMRLLGTLEKPRFRAAHLPHYLWVQGSLITGFFRYVSYRLRRLFAR